MRWVPTEMFIRICSVSMIRLPWTYTYLMLIISLRIREGGGMLMA
jgi:hypothetical protein